MFKKDTIAAISTGMVQSGIGIVRMSGEEALEILSRIYRSPSGHKDIRQVPTHTLHYGYIYDGETLIDEVMVAIMRGPRSYTTEDVVEIDCHGGMIVMKKLLETVVKYGARPAEPGELTKRAFLNGRIDLSQAEAVIDVINSKNTMALSSSLGQLRGGMKKKIAGLRHEILGNVAAIEAAMDDPEHFEDSHFSDALGGRVSAYLDEIEALLQSADSGRMVSEGIRTAIVGKPNAGKSSLMNALLGEERAIVTEIEGTTRDTLEELMNLHGIPLKIIDTAGIRDTEDIVEKIGVRKAVSAVNEADLVIYVADGSRALDDNDRAIMEMIRDKRAIVLLNKSDLERQLTVADLESMVHAPILEISAREQTGLEAVEKMIREMFFSGRIDYNDEVLITNARHKAALEAARESLRMVEDSIREHMPEDFYSIDLMDAYESLGLITGETVGEDLADRIFSEFCMGK